MTQKNSFNNGADFFYCLRLTHVATENVGKRSDVCRKFDFKNWSIKQWLQPHFFQSEITMNFSMHKPFQKFHRRLKLAEKELTAASKVRVYLEESRCPILFEQTNPVIKFVKWAKLFIFRSVDPSFVETDVGDTLVRAIRKETSYIS